MTSGEALTIGEFGRRAGLSAKALRLYDESGLLPPDSVDPSNGYRLYSPAQLERARRISMLRQLGIPLATVTDVLGAPNEEAAHQLDRWWHEQETTLAERKKALDWLRARFTRTGGDFAARPVTTREVPDTKIASIRAATDQAGLLAEIIGNTMYICDYLAQAGVEMTGESWVIYHGYVAPDSAGDIEICVPFSGPADPHGPIALRVEPARVEAFCTISRDECFYPRIMFAYDLLEDWIADAALPRAGAVREIYLPQFAAGPTDQPSVHIAQPITR
ncbi:MerR family transcriptional regulator [Kribbella deserti]|uniref:MerR family transcriptional regulator n=1 Tax=Kribbella deserti TaxID=1926257 RepID=A0ABV6QVA7_9ACTN